jgi:hypothetical protein
VDDLGGHESLDVYQRIGLDSVRSILIIVLQIGRYADKKEEIIEDGKLTSVLSSDFLKYLKELRLAVRDLKATKLGKQIRTPSLDDWIDQQEKVSEDN